MNQHDAAGGGAPPSRSRSWEEFVEASYATIWRLCAALAGQDAADDLAQETFLRATRALPARRNDASGRIWILSIARSVCMDELRARYRRSRRDEHLAAGAVRAGAAADPGGEVMVHALLEGLEPDRRSAFVLTQLFGLSYEQAAAVCDCPVGTIRSRVARARNDLIGQMAPRESRPRHAAK